MPSQKHLKHQVAERSNRRSCSSERWHRALARRQTPAKWCLRRPCGVLGPSGLFSVIIRRLSDVFTPDTEGGGPDFFGRDPEPPGAHRMGDSLEVATPKSCAHPRLPPSGRGAWRPQLVVGQVDRLHFLQVKRSGQQGDTQQGWLF